MTKRHHRHAGQAATAPRLPQQPALSDPRLHRIVILILFIIPVMLFFRFLIGSRLLFGTDFIGDGGYAAHRFMADYIKSHGAVAFWQPDILCGQPTVAAFFGDLFYPTIILRLFLSVHLVWAWTFALHLFLAGLGTYLFLKEQRLTTIAAGIGGIAYMLSGSLITLTFAGHDGRLIGSALLPLALLFLHRGMTRQRLIHFLLCGLILGLQLLSGHVQKVYYTGLMLTAYFLFMLLSQVSRLPRNQRLLAISRGVGSFAIALIFAGMLSAIQYLPIYGNLRYGARGGNRNYAYATSWSLHPAETFDLLTPHFSGAVNSPSRLGQYYHHARLSRQLGPETYWGPNLFKLHSEYLGIIPLLFAALAIFGLWRRREVKFFFLTFLGALIMAWGGHTFLYRIPYHLFPGVAKFRGPAMIFFVAAFSLVSLASFGLNHLIENRLAASGRSSPMRRLRPAILCGILPAGLLILILLAGNSAARLFGAASPVKAAAFSANLSSLTTGLLFAVILWAAGITLGALFASGRLTSIPFAAITAAVMLLDSSVSLKLWDEQQGYIPGLPRPEAHFAPDAVIRSLKEDTSMFRVLPIPGQYDRDRDGLLWLHGIQSAAGSIPNPLQTWQEFIGADTLVGFLPYNFFDSLGLRRNFIDLLNIKYVIAQTRNGPAIFPNDSCLPRAFIALRYEVLPDREAVLNRLKQSDFSPGSTALLYKDPGLESDTASSLTDSATAMATITRYDANEITLRATLSRPGILVLSENYHPDWRVTVDGRPAELLQAYHTLRAVALPAGDHQVQFSIIPRYYRLGSALTLVATGLLAVIGVVSIVRRKKRPQPATAA